LAFLRLGECIPMRVLALGCGAIGREPSSIVGHSWGGLE